MHTTPIIACTTRTTGKIDKKTFEQIYVLHVYNLRVTTFESD